MPVAAVERQHCAVAFVAIMPRVRRMHLAWRKRTPNGRTTPFTGGAANPVNTQSSDGPRRFFFNTNGVPYTPGNFSSTGGIVLQKPDITAATGVKTTFPTDSGLNPFFGTSAAAPHAGAIAAQILSFRPGLTPSQVRTALYNSCLDIEAAGFDRDSGRGIVMALAQ